MNKLIFLLFHSIEANDSDDLEEGDDEERDGAHVTVEDLQPVVPRSQREDQRHQEAQHTDQTYISISLTYALPYLHTASISGFGTCEELFGHPLGHHVQVEQRRQDALQIPKHGGQTQTEQHDEEEHGPHLRTRHLRHRLREHDERQTRS